MKALFKYIGLSFLFLFSFYYTEKINSMLANNSNLMKEISSNKDKYNIEAVSATIDGDYIIPGIIGKSVNVLKSYNNMKVDNVFNEYFLEYDVMYPTLSIKNNKDKIIRKGNKLKNSVSIIVSNNEDVINYNTNNNVLFDRLVNKSNIRSSSFYEQINNDKDDFEKVLSYLEKYNINKNICIIDEIDKNVCLKYKSYLVKYSKVLSDYNIVDIKNDIKSGDIIYVSDDVNISHYKILLRQINYQDLNILYLSDLISE